MEFKINTTLKSSILDTLEYSKKLIISPDVDGFMSAKLINKYNGSVVVGGYDKNILTLADGIDPKECLFVDCDMNRPEFVSIGNHMRLSSDNVSVESFNPNSHFEVEKYVDKFPYATCFLITFATGVETSDLDKNKMAYADSTYKNLIKYERNMRNWATRIYHNDVERILNPRSSDHAERLWVEKEYPKQSFVSKQFGKTRYIEALNNALESEKIKYLPITHGTKYKIGLVDKNTVMRYSKDIISYAEIYSGEYSVTYDQIAEW
jgi:hypothetical protein